MRSILALLVVSACLAAIPSSLHAEPASEAVFVLFRSAEGYWAECMVTVPGASDVSMGAEMDFTAVGGGEFEIRSPLFDTLGDMNDDIAGGYTMEITHAGGVSKYAFSLLAVSESLFPALPVLDAVPANIPQQYTFGWNWAGAADMRWVEYDASNGTESVRFELVSESTDAEFAVLSLDADFGDYVGTGKFLVEYASIVDGAIVAGWQRTEGIDVFDGGGLIEAFISGDEAAYFVVPEPAGVAALAVAALAILRRRRCRV